MPVRKLLGKNAVANLLLCSFHRTEICEKTTTVTWEIITEDTIEYIFACKTTDLSENNSKVRSVPWLGKRSPKNCGESTKSCGGVRTDFFTQYVNHEK